MKKSWMLNWNLKLGIPPYELSLTGKARLERYSLVLHLEFINTASGLLITLCFITQRTVRE